MSCLVLSCLVLSCLVLCCVVFIFHLIANTLLPLLLASHLSSTYPHSYIYPTAPTPDVTAHYDCTQYEKAEKQPEQRRYGH